MIQRCFSIRLVKQLFRCLLVSTPIYMIAILQVGTQTITSSDIVPLLTQYQLLTPLIREVLIDQAIAAIELPEEILQATCEAFYEQQQIGDPEMRQQWLQQTGLSEPQLINLATRSLRIQAFKQQRWGQVIESDFLVNKSHLDQISYSLLRTTSPEIAQELYFRIQSGEQDFAEAATEYTEGEEAKTGGLIGPVPLTQAHPAIIERLRQGKTGQLFPPIQIDQWFVLVRLEQRLAAQLDDATKQKLLDHRFESWLTEQMQQPQPAAQPQPSEPPTKSNTRLQQPVLPANVNLAAQAS
jgi:parvulin-like peptidyl-prolyl isomerase